MAELKYAAVTDGVIDSELLDSEQEVREWMKANDVDYEYDVQGFTNEDLAELDKQPEV